MDPTWQPDAVLQRLCAGLAHDITNFISGVIGYGDIFREWLIEQEADPTIRSRMEFLLTSAERFERQVGRLRLLAGRIDPTIGGLDLQDLVASLNVRSATSHGATLVLEHADDLTGRLQIEPKLLLEIITACRSLASDTADPAFCRITADGTSCTILVILPGAAVDPHHLPHLHEPYYARRELGHGDGLGLPMAAVVARHLGGSLDFNDTAAGELACRLELPLAPPA